ncbi:MAG: sortase [Thermoleophilia bacterium]
MLIVPLLRRSVVLLPLILLALLAGAGCGGEKQQLPGSRINMDAIGSKTAVMAEGLDKRVSLMAVTISAKKYRTALQMKQRIGSIEIPRIGIREWVIQGASTEELKLGAGHIEETSIPGLGGNFAIAGDRVLYSAPFLRLEQMQVGDELLVHMPYADFVYQVEIKTNVDPTDISVLNPRGYDSVTLSTCDPIWDLQTRIIIFARLVNTVPRA